MEPIIRRWGIFYALLRASLIEFVVVAGLVLVIWAVVRTIYRLGRRY